ncbi:hypothetical protein [Marinicella meishanensis]|uniref:hypothetical protein n=1 Tax=Marinicella meishanensis TaxID=2873263 RepID=UPI001CBB0E3F|nr:hypothetical protein [Marinicella sp. NBU2979]
MKLMRYVGLMWLGLMTPASAQNLLANGTFDTDVSGWFAFTTITHASDEGAPISGQGSLLNTGVFNNNSSFPAISDPFVVTPGHWYLTGASYKVPAASPVPWAWYQIFWYDAGELEVGRSDMVSGVFGAPKDQWHDMAGLSQAPANAATGELRIYLQTAETGNPDVPFGLWDDVFVLPDTVFYSNFD